MDKEIENERYSRLKKNSTEGGSGKRDGEYARIKKSTYRKNMRTIAIATALATTLVIGGGAKVYKKLVDNATLTTLVVDFKKDVISPETHRTDNNQYYFYYYDNIADRIESMENPDIGYYLLYRNIGTEQTNRVLQQTSYGSFNQYLSEHNFTDAEDFSKKMAEITLLDNEIKEKEEELNTQIDDIHNTDNSNDSYGGKK